MKLVTKIKGCRVDVLWQSSWRYKTREKLHKAASLAKNAHLMESFVSLSHTDSVGGFAICRKPVGFDLEASTRKLSNRAFQRLGSDAEQSEAPSRLALWVAKEAAWKACQGPKQPQTITKIAIQHWRKNQPSAQVGYTFKFSYSNNLDVILGYGRLFTKGRLLMGIAVLFH